MNTEVFKKLVARECLRHTYGNCAHNHGHCYCNGRSKHPGTIIIQKQTEENRVEHTHTYTCKKNKSWKTFSGTSNDLRSEILRFWKTFSDLRSLLVPEKVLQNLRISDLRSLLVPEEVVQNLRISDLRSLLVPGKVLENLRISDLRSLLVPEM